MARGVNKVILIGNLGNDPDVRSTSSGMAVCTLSVATAERRKDQSGEWQDHTEWHRVKLFGKTAEVARDYLKKGRQVYIEGSLRTTKYTDKNGVERYSTDIVCNDMQMLGSGGGEGGGYQQREQPQGGYGGGQQRGGYAPAPSPSAPASTGGFEDDDIPF